VEEALTPSKTEYEAHHEALVAYLHEKVKISDWHGVADAACDLRVLEAQGYTDVERKP
jgi:hypothetical protein